MKTEVYGSHEGLHVTVEPVWEVELMDGQQKINVIAHNFEEAAQNALILLSTQFTAKPEDITMIHRFSSIGVAVKEEKK